MADDKERVSQDDIEKLLAQAGAQSSGPIAQNEVEALLASAGASVPASSAKPAAAKAASFEGVSPDDIELLLNKAEEALASIDSGKEGSQPLPVGMRTFEFEKFRGSSANSEAATLELMRDVQLDMTVELGRTHMHLEDVLQLRKGAVVPLDKLAGDPADIFVNGRLIARGEVLVLNDNFCIRVAELIVGEAA
jgi:flagellar motor switch protein FliN/FliY